MPYTNAHGSSSEYTATTGQYQSAHHQFYQATGTSESASSPARQVFQQETANFPTKSIVDENNNSTNEALDRKFYTMMLEIDKRYQTDNKLQKHEKIRIEQWVSIFLLLKPNLESVDYSSFLYTFIVS